jgi:phosphoribosylanthranilate isomerase
LADYAPVVDRFLLDAKAPPGAPLPGGNAAPFDWTLTAGRAIPRPWLLAGGLTPENVGQAIAVSGAPGVDVSSGVERARGVKDPARIAAFVGAARAA